MRAELELYNEVLRQALVKNPKSIFSIIGKFTENDFVEEHKEEIDAAMACEIKPD